MYPSKGITFIRNDAAKFQFCRSKCHKNFKMKRNPRKLGWTKAFRKARGKELTVDPTLQFAARRNVPVRYDRELMKSTLRAMERVEEIRARRERVFYKDRVKGEKARKRAEDRRTVETGSHLLPREREEQTMEDVVREAAPLEITAQEKASQAAAIKSKSKLKEKGRQRILVNGGTVPDRMDIDS